MFIQLLVDLCMGTQTTHGMLIRRLYFSVDRFEAQPFHFFCCFQNPFTIAAEIKIFKIFDFCSNCKGILKTPKKKWNGWTSKWSREKSRRRIEIPWVVWIPPRIRSVSWKENWIHISYQFCAPDPNLVLAITLS